MDDKIKNPLGGILSGNFDGWNDPPDPDGELLKRALERVTQRRKIRVLEEEVAKLRSRSRHASKIDQRYERAAPLKQLVRAVKSKLSNRQSQLDVAKRVDKLLEKSQKSLSSVAPQSWENLGLPSTLTEVFTNQGIDRKLKRLVKTYISKA
jgi:hypothetical protein